ncbi:TPA: ead/Ea22-like family protein [Raoultella planticola]
MTDITELAKSLKAAAEKAGIEQWVNNHGEVNTADYDVDGGMYIDHICDCEIVGTESPRAEFIALANPENILALVEALEKAQRANGHLREQSAEWERKAISNFEECAKLSQRVEELESRTVKLPDDAEHDIMAPVAAYLSEKFKWDGGAARWDGRKEYDVLADRVKYAIRMVIRRAAGIKVEAE